MPARIPIATYRLQLNREFNFTQAAELVDYLEALGVSDAYLSPVLTARAGSTHGYDVVNHEQVHPELGGEGALIFLLDRLRERGMGAILDVVPNHMCITGGGNRWWNDVLENGPSSPYARYFDIDWNPPKEDLVAKVLLPILGDQYGRVLENQEIRIRYEAGAFFACYYEHRFPLAPRSLIHILGPVVPELRATMGAADEAVQELESILTAVRHLPRRTETEREQVEERRREKEIIKRRLGTLMEAHPGVRQAIERSLADLNGRRGEPHSFDRLEALLGDQAFRLSFWRVASDEINYRRFFDINELAAIRVEEPEVFAAVHEVLFRLIEHGGVTGARIDHLDGLREPVGYVEALQRRCHAALQLARSRAAASAKGLTAEEEESRCPCYLIVEKILVGDEPLHEGWPVHGTTGYEFLQRVGGVLVDRSSARRLREIYEGFVGEARRYRDVAYESKKLILRVAMSSELTVLARRLDRISEYHRYSRDFTLNSLQEALAELIACFPVYRSYVAPEDVTLSDVDRAYVEAAVRTAKRRNPAMSASLFDFLRQLLLCEDPEGLDEHQRAERRDFVLRLQQLTSPVTAKGIEDTAFYRYFPLASLNEVGGEPDRLGYSVEEFHRFNLGRQRAWPHGLSATTTHDTKRSEDTRARIAVLSEVPEVWAQAVARWRTLNQRHKTDVGGTEFPDPNEEYLLYQTLIGTWPLVPLDAAGHERYVGRILEYMNKALKEAKVHTSWVNPNEAHDRAVERFVQAVLEPGGGHPFPAEVAALVRRIAPAGLCNALAQVVLKIATPRRAGLLSGHGAVGLQPGGSGQPAAGGLRAAPPAARGATRGGRRGATGAGRASSRSSRGRAGEAPRHPARARSTPCSARAVRTRRVSSARGPARTRRTRGTGRRIRAAARRAAGGGAGGAGLYPSRDTRSAASWTRGVAGYDGGARRERATRALSRCAHWADGDGGRRGEPGGGRGVRAFASGLARALLSRDPPPDERQGYHAAAPLPRAC